jgi:CHAT domain-containing protein
MLEKAGQPEQARIAYEESIRIIENIRGNLSIEEFKSSYLGNKRVVYERLIDLLERMGRSADAFSYSERARARTFLDILANKKIDFRGLETSELIRAEQEKRFEIRNMYRLLQSSNLAGSCVTGARQADTRMIYEELRNSQEEYQEILLQIKLNHPDYSQLVNIEPFDLEKIRSSLDGRTAVIAYWISEQEIHAWLIGRDVFQHSRVSSGRQQIQDRVETIRRNISSYSSSGMDPALSELYHTLLEPLASGLKGYTDLVIVPNGPLHFFPFQILVDGDNKYLVEDYNISYAPSASVYLICTERSRKNGNRFLGMALGDVSLGDFSGLPGTEEEVTRIRDEFKDNSRIYMAGNSTETTMKNESPLYQYIHLATHGSYNYFQPLYSFLLFNPSE